MKDGRKYSEQEIQLIAKSAIGKKIKDLYNSQFIELSNDDDSSDGNKGSIGQIVEKYLFGINTNSDSEPDFIDAGIELKVTPYRKNKKDNSLSAKERLVLNIIDYETEYKNNFQTSHFWFKNNKIQLLWYLWEENKNKDDFIITNEHLLNLIDSKDLNQIEKDWNLIIDKIKKGKAHEISEADTMYLGACTKGANSLSKRKQPFSNELAMQRAFCFKTSYMTQLVRQYIGNYSDIEKLVKGNSEFDEYVNSTIKNYIGKTRTELIKFFEIDSKAKNINQIIINRMFNLKGNLSETDEFLKANITPRTIRVEENGKIIESLPLPTFKYTDIVREKWETCELKEVLETTKYMFFIFKNNGSDYIFNGIKLWNIPETILENNVKNVWIRTKHTIQTGKIVKEVLPNKRLTNFPGMSEDDFCHVRPHAKNANDTYELPVADIVTGLTSYTKHCFWINNKYLEKIVNE